MIRGLAIDGWDKVLFTAGILENVCHLLRILIQRLELDLVSEDFVWALEVALILASACIFLHSSGSFLRVADLLGGAIDQILNVSDANIVGELQFALHRILFGAKNTLVFI